MYNLEYDRHVDCCEAHSLHKKILEFSLVLLPNNLSEI